MPNASRLMLLRLEDSKACQDGSSLLQISAQTKPPQEQQTSSGERAGSAALSSGNVAGRGILLKAHTHSGIEELHNLMPRWDDVRAKYVTILDEFPGQLDAQGELGVDAPGLAELSGVIALMQAGDYRLALQCSGSCLLYLFGMHLPALWSEAGNGLTSRLPCIVLLAKVVLVFRSFVFTQTLCLASVSAAWCRHPDDS
jgi:hypothetical protein